MKIVSYKFELFEDQCTSDMFFIPDIEKVLYRIHSYGKADRYLQSDESYQKQFLINLSKKAEAVPKGQTHVVIKNAGLCTDIKFHDMDEKYISEMIRYFNAIDSAEQKLSTEFDKLFL